MIATAGNAETSTGSPAAMAMTPTSITPVSTAREITRAVPLNRCDTAIKVTAAAHRIIKAETATMTMAIRIETKTDNVSAPDHIG